MSVGINPPKTPVTKGSNGIAAATIPNVCKMPGPPAPFVPAPLPNIGKSGSSPKGYTKKVKADGDPVAVRGASFGSMGDMASKGTGGGIVSANTHGPCKFIGPGSMDVKFEGKNVHLLSDPVTNNGAGSGTPANAATMVGVAQTFAIPEEHLRQDEDKCQQCKSASRGESYEDFFTEEERGYFDIIASLYPGLETMLPPSNAKYSFVKPSKVKARYKKFKEAMRRAKKAGAITVNGPVHHPHPRKYGGCSLHQDLIDIDGQDKKDMDEKMKNVMDYVNARKNDSQHHRSTNLAKIQQWI